MGVSSSERAPGSGNGVRVRPTICDICNPVTHCGIQAHVKEGRLVRVEGWPDHPHSQGTLCPKGAASRQYILHPDRLLRPLKRTGPRGGDGFEPITWDEALETIAARLSRIKSESGPESVVFYAGYPKWMRPFLKRLALNFGSPNYCTESSVCNEASLLAAKLNYGAWGTPDLGRTRCLLIWGRNPFWSSPPLARKILAAKKRGLRIIDVGPLVTPTTAQADIHLRLRPGTSGALAAGLAQVIIQEDLQDREFVARWTKGLGDFAAYVREFTPQRTEEITGIPAGEIRRAARLYAQTKPASLLTSPNTSVHHTNGVDNHRLITLLPGLTGNFDRPGGNHVIPESYVYVANGLPTRQHLFQQPRSWEELPDRLGQDRFPVWSRMTDQAQALVLPHQIRSGRPYPIRGLVAFGLNHRLWPGSDYTFESLKKLDFLVVSDLFLTQSAKLADLILPACSSFERSELKLYPGKRLLFTRPALEPLGQSRSDVEIIIDLARRLIPQDELLGQGHEACLDWILAPSGVTVKELKKHPPGLQLDQVADPGFFKYRTTGFKTPSGKMEFTSTVLAELGLDPLPRYREPFLSPVSTPEKAVDFPLILTTGARLPMFIHGRTFRVPYLRRLRPDPMVDLNPLDARERGLSQGDRVELSTPRGSLILRANLTGTVPPGVVSVYHNLPGADVNTLIEPDYQDPLSGYPGFKSLLCQVAKVGPDQEERKENG